MGGEACVDSRGVASGKDMAEAGIFRSAGHSWRLFCGPGAIEAHLAAAVGRTGASRAFVVCSPSITGRTDLFKRIQAALGDACVGVFDGIENDSTYASVKRATDAARAAGADLLIAVGGGSVIVAVRAVAIFLAEAGDPFALMTQYPENARPFSPRLEAPKPPIVNIPTTPTSAMNRGGSGLKNPDLDHRMEYFDPKTRPSAIFLDEDALMTAPATLARSTGTTVFASLVATAGEVDANPLVSGDLAQAMALAFPAYRRLAKDPDDPRLRRDLALAAFLQNRAEDDGRAMRSRGVYASDYAVATALHLHFPSIGQGEATSALHASTIRLAPTPDIAAAEATARALDLWSDGMTAESATTAIADGLEAVYSGTGMPTRLRDLPLSRDDLTAVAADTVKNFNASASLAAPEVRIAHSLRVLETAW